MGISHDKYKMNSSTQKKLDRGELGIVSYEEKKWKDKGIEDGPIICDKGWILGAKRSIKN